jgi:hypothetical protein
LPIILQVRDVRDAIYLSTSRSASAGSGSPSTLLLGRLFHEVFAALAGSDPTRNFHAAIDEAEPELDEWQRALIKHSYYMLVGPRLRERQAVLHHISDQVLIFWDGVQEMCRWLGELLWQAKLQGNEDLDLSDQLRVEQSLVWELREPEWTDSVRLTGIADAVWKLPDDGRWCVVELKTGQTAPEADLAQACLYHQMLLAGGEQAHGTLALASFEPELRERLFSAAELTQAQTSLVNLIGRLAGVSPKQSGERPAATIKSPPASSEHERIGAKLIETLREYGAEVTLSGPAIVGPAFLRFRITLGPRVKLRAVEQLAKEVQVRLQLDAPPRIGTENGRVVVDLQRPDRQTVLFSQIRPQLPQRDAQFGCAQAPLGVDLTGRLRLIDFAQPESSHLLVAGSTGSGKSEWLRTAVAGLTEVNSPETLRLLIIDPKRNAFHALRDSTFLVEPIVYPDERPVAQVLSNLADEMDRRYQLLGEKGDDSLASYIQRTGLQIPRIFCICDEYADLISGDRKVRREIESQITRLGQKARAAGIHLILATQHPSREIIKGVLDSNIPARVALRVQKPIESKMVLNYTGAETLLGRGDLLFRDVGEPVRLQGAYFDE